MKSIREGEEIVSTDVKIAVVLHTLQDLRGHEYNFAVSIHQGLKEVFSNSQIDFIVGEYTHVPDKDFFLKLIPDYVSYSFKSKGIHKVISLFRTATLINELIDNLESAYDCIVFSDGYELRLLLALIVRRKLVNKPIFVYLHSLYMIKPYVKKFAWISKGFKNIFFLTYNEQDELDGLTKSFVRSLETKGGKIFFHAPYPVFTQGFAKPKMKVGSGKFTLGYLGAASSVRGYQEVVDFILYLSQSDNYCYDFLLTAYPPRDCKDEKLLNYIDSIKLANVKNVKLIPTPLPMEEYYETLNSISAMLLLYDEKYYKHLFSGILLEAFALGKPAIVTPNTWLSRQVNKFDAGVVVQSTRPEDVLKAVKKLESNYEYYSANALRAAQYLLEIHNARTLALFIKEILENPHVARKTP